jgi:hypothetical protein
MALKYGLSQNIKAKNKRQPIKGHGLEAVL